MEQDISQQPAETLSEVLRVRREKLEELRSAGHDPFVTTRFEKTHSSENILADFERLEGQTVRIAGRLMSKRIMGKASFSHLQDFDGQIQLYVRRDVLGTREQHVQRRIRRHLPRGGRIGRIRRPRAS